MYAEHIFICIAAPLLLSVVLLKGETRLFNAFFVCGMLACLISAYINSFLTAAFQVPVDDAVITYTPVVEELIKMIFPLLYVLLIDPGRKRITPVCLAVGIGFATLENCCYLAEYGAENFFFVLIRGCAVGVMHTICTLIVSHGLNVIYRNKVVIAMELFGLLCTASTYHAIYNLLISGNQAEQMIGYLLPMVTVAIYLLLILLFRKKKTGTGQTQNDAK